MPDLHEDDFSGDVQGGRPTETVDVEAAGGIDVADAEGKHVQARFHAENSRSTTVARLERIGQTTYSEIPLRGPFSCWWTTVIGADGPPSRILPDNSADFVVAEAADSWFVGPAESAELADFPVGTQIRGLRIRPGCVGAVTRTPAHELANRSVGTDDLLGSALARELGELIWAGPTAALPLLGEVSPPRTRRLVRDLVRFPSVAASELAGPYALSERQLRRLVLDEAGLAPKTLQKVARMQQFLRMADQQGRPLADAAWSAGYADQSHLTRDVRRLTGLPPARLLAERRARKSAA